MNEYIKFMFQQHVIKSSSKEFNSYIKPQLLQLKQVDLTKIYKQLTNSTLLFNELNLLMGKGVVKYSPANCSVELSLSNVMVYQRLQKLIRFGYKSLHPHISEFIKEWIQQGLQNGLGYPVMFQKSLISKVFLNTQPIQPGQQQDKKRSKSIKQKHEQKQAKSTTNEQYNYHRLVYEYKSTQKQTLQPSTINDNKLNQQGQELYNNNNKNDQKIKPTQQQQEKKPTSKSKNKDTTKKNKQQQQKQPTKSTTIKQQPIYQQYMLNLQQLTRLFQSQKVLDIINSRLTQKEKKLSLFQFLQSKDRQSIIQRIRWQKQQEYIGQILGGNCLLVYNLIRKYPYITEKQLGKLTLMEVLQTRQALNRLLQRGWVYFYNENARTIVYKVCDQSILYKQFIDNIARSILNLSLAAERISQSSTYTNSLQQVKSKLIQLQCQIQRLDDILLIFGY